MPDQESKEWTIIFLIYADLRLQQNEPERTKIERELRFLFSDIKNCELESHSQIYIVYNIIKKYRNKDEDIDNTYLIGVEKKRSAPRSKNRLKIERKFCTDDIVRKPDILGEIFKLINNKFSSDKKLLITWDHGSSFGIFPKTNANSSNQQYVFYANPAYTRPWDKSINSNNNIVEAQAVLDILSNEELAKAIKIGFEGKLDVLLMMNCIVQSLHTGYALKNSVHYLVAPETGIDEPGYNYIAIINYIMRQLKTTTESVARFAVSSIAFNDRCNETYKKNIAQWSVFCIDLSQYESLTRLIDKVASFILNEIKKRGDKFKENVISSRNNCFRFDLGDNYCLIDTETWLWKLVQNIMLRDLIFYYDEFLFLKSLLIKEKFIGINVYSDFESFPGEWQENKSPSGFAIYYPFDSDSVENDIYFLTFVTPNAKERSIFFEETHWYIYLEEILLLNE